MEKMFCTDCNVKSEKDCTCSSYMKTRKANIFRNEAYLKAQFPTLPNYLASSSSSSSSPSSSNAVEESRRLNPRKRGR